MKTVERILGEARIMDPAWAYFFAKETIKGRFPEGEPIIATNPGWAYNYALCVIKGRWPEAEPTIAKSPDYAYLYALNVINGRFPEGEPTIKDSEWMDEYLWKFPDAKDDWAIYGWLDWLDT